MSYAIMKENKEKMMTRVVLEISYLGTNYHGWQGQNGNQKHLLTIQGVVEEGIKKALGEYISLVASGRTDQGVSAICQVAHMDTCTTIPPEKIKYVINQYLPEDIRILKSYPVHDQFHARFHAKEKTYRYSIYLSDTTIPYYENFATRVHGNLNIEDMKKASAYLVGEHDYTSFCAASTEVESKVRTIHSLTIEKHGQLIEFTICGNGFLYNMVRILVGTLLDVGKGKIHSEDILSIMQAKDRTKAGKTMPAKGLVLVDVRYDSNK